MRCFAHLLLLLVSSAQAGNLGQEAAPRVDAESVAPTRSVRSRFIAHCAGCHGQDAAGSQLGQVPDMRAMGNFLRVPGGREFLIQVPGVMGSGLSDGQVAEVSNWLLAGMARAAVPAGHQPYTEAEVRAARARPLLDVAAARRALVARAQQQGIEMD